MLMNWKSLTTLKLTKTLRRTVFVYTLKLFRLVIALKLISDCLIFSRSIWVVSENPTGNTVSGLAITCCSFLKTAGTVIASDPGDLKVVAK